MMKFGYLCDHNSYGPLDLEKHAILADSYGFDTIWASDHFHPWFHTNAHAGFAWVWIASTLAKTERAMIGTGVTAPHIRYHPAVVAQAFATLEYMYPRRVFLGVGTGEAINEVPLSLKWPRFKERVAMFEEAIKVINILWNSRDFADFDGQYFRLNQARLYTKPQRPPLLYLAGNGPTVARIAGKYADGFLTLSTIQAIKEFSTQKLFPAIKEGAKERNRDMSNIDLIIQLFVSYDEDVDKAIESARRWAGPLSPVFKNRPSKGLDPRVIEEYGKSVSKEAIAKEWTMTTNADHLIKAIESYLSIGFTHINVVSASPNEEKLIRLLGEEVFPYLKERYSR